MGINTIVKIGKLKLKNPVMTASGTFGYADEFKDFIDLSKLGAIVTKTITLKKRKGNVPPRTCETASGMLNSIGLQNPGIDVFIDEKIPILAKTAVPIIVSIASEGGIEDLKTIAKRLNGIKEVAGIEVNISCPNVGPMLISQDAKATYKAISVVRKSTSKTLIAKLSPNVTDITEIAKAAENAGSDGISLINTLTGIAVDIETRRPKLGNVTGGLSGPAIKPVALKMVRQVFGKVKIPIIGIGGIMNYKDALEFMICGATAVQIGTANFVNPKATVEIIDGIEKYLREKKISSLNNLVGSLKT